MTKYDLTVKWVKVNQSHHLNKLGRSPVPNASYQVSRSLAIRFLRTFSKPFTIYRHGGHLGHVKQLLFPHLIKAPHSEEISFENVDDTDADDDTDVHADVDADTNDRPLPIM